MITIFVSVYVCLLLFRLYVSAGPTQFNKGYLSYFSLPFCYGQSAIKQTLANSTDYMFSPSRCNNQRQVYFQVRQVRF